MVKVGSLKQQAITGDNVDADLCRRMALQGYNEYSDGIKIFHGLAAEVLLATGAFHSPSSFWHEGNDWQAALIWSLQSGNSLKLLIRYFHEWK